MILTYCYWTDSWCSTIAASLIFKLLWMIIEKIIFNKYTIHPLKMVYLWDFMG